MINKIKFSQKLGGVTIIYQKLTRKFSRPSPQHKRNILDFEGSEKYIGVTMMYLFFVCFIFFMSEDPFYTK